MPTANRSDELAAESGHLNASSHLPCGCLQVSCRCWYLSRQVASACGGRNARPRLGPPASGGCPADRQHADPTGAPTARSASNPRAAATGSAPGRGWGEGDRADQGSAGAVQAAGRDEAPPMGRPQDIGMGKIVAAVPRRVARKNLVKKAGAGQFTTPVRPPCWLTVCLLGVSL